MQHDIGKILMEARESKQKSIEDAAKSLKIKKAYLQMLEEGNFNSLSEKVYIKGYLKSYSNWLGMDSRLITRWLLL